jgi:hypothetical protein
VCEVACADYVQAFDLGIPGYFLYTHSFACGSTIWAVNMQVGYYSHCFHLAWDELDFSFQYFFCEFFEVYP